MRVLLVQPPEGRSVVGFSKFGCPEPLALEILAASLAEHDVRILDMRLDPDLENSVRTFRPHVIGVTGYTPNVPQMLASLQEEARILSGSQNHTIVFDVQDDLFLQGDHKQLDSVFTNLLVNAINYTPAGGAIKVRWYQDDNGAHYEVNDTGIGIAPALSAWRCPARTQAAASSSSRTARSPILMGGTRCSVRSSRGRTSWMLWCRAIGLRRFGC